MNKKLVVGQYLWCVPGNRSEEPKQVQVTGIGAKMATLDTGAKISERTLLPTCGVKDFRTRFYLSKAEWLRHVEIEEGLRQAYIERQWTMLRRLLVDRDMSLSDDEAAAIAVKLLLLLEDLPDIPVEAPSEEAVG